MRLRILVVLPVLAAAIVGGPVAVLTDHAAGKSSHTSVSDEASRYSGAYLRGAPNPSS